MLRFIVVLALLALANGHPSHKNHSSLGIQFDPIVGGQPATIEQRPYQVSLLNTDVINRSYTCGGSILSERYVLTAAHCFPGITSVQVRAGSDHLSVGGITAKTYKYIVHPSFIEETGEYDIAIVDLLKNALPINNKTIKAVKLISGKEPSDGTAVTVSGFGLTNETGEMSETLMQVTVNIINRATCQDEYTSLNPITDTMICAGMSKGGKDTCQGDSGGPLVRDSDNVQVGVVSFGFRCAIPKYPGVYSNIAVLRNWIKEQTGI